MKSTFLSAVVLTSIALLPAVVAPGQTASAGSVAPPPTLLPAASSEYSVVERGPHHRVWAKVTWETNASGRVIARTNAYTELASGMHHRDPNTGQWLESQEVIESYPGGAIARRGQHQVIFANDLATAGAIDMQTPDGKRLTSHVLGLSYFDASTGTNVLIAEVTNCVGKILPPNQVIYENAFDTLKASVRYTYTRGGFEQDIILLEALTGPEAYGLNPATTRLVVMTEFVNPPQPALQQSLATDAAGTPLEDDALDFGAMQVGTGRGFLLGQSATGAGLTVFKQWANIEGRQFLIEQVRAPDLFKAINSLPAKQGASLNSNRRAIRFTASTRELPSLKPGKADTKAMELTASRQPQKGYVLDYFFTVISTNNFTFQNDTTYFVSGPVSITWGTFEGGAVIKFTNRVNATISFAVVSCLTGPYRMAILTSKDDDSVGASISGSTGSPTNWNGAWYISSGQSDLNYLRFSFANTGAHITGGMTGQWGGPGPTIWHCQFIKCSAALEVETGGFFQGPRFSIYNTLFAGCRVCISTSNGGTPNCYNVTADGGLYFDTDTSDTITFENSIVTGCSLLGHVSAGWTIISSNAAGFYQPVGAGGYYLADGSTNRNAGTTNIPLRLLADLRQKTTYPPIVLTNNITADTILSPQAQRDTDAPDLGYHADPLDYAISGLTVTNTLLLTNGVAVATYGASAALTLSGSGQLLSQGLANNLNHIVRYNTVQEQSTTNWSSTNVFDSLAFGDQSASAQCAFTAWSIPAGSGNHVNQANDATGSWFAHNQFAGGTFAMNPGLVALTNCLWERVSLTLDDEAGNDSWYLYNNLFRGGSISYRIRGGSSVAVAYDNLFDCTAIAPSGSSANFTSGYNGYVTTNATLSGTQPGDVTLTNNPVYQTNYLGNYYYPTNGGLLSTLIDVGSRWATNAGLYHFTTTTNQVKEGATQVDIGFHYVAIDPATGQPYDTDGDGVPDYFEDANGDGVHDAGDHSDWTTYDSLNGLTGGNGLQVFTPLK